MKKVLRDINQQRSRKRVTVILSIYKMNRQEGLYLYKSKRALNTTVFIGVLK